MLTKKISRKGFNRLAELESVRRTLASLEARKNNLREDLLAEMGRLKSLSLPGGGCLYRKVIKNPGYTVKPHKQTRLQVSGDIPLWEESHG